MRTLDTPAVDAPAVATNVVQHLADQARPICDGLARRLTSNARVRGPSSAPRGPFGAGALMRFGLSELLPEVRRRTRTVVELLAKAEGSTNEFERHAFYAKANDMLADLVASGQAKVPARARLALTTAVNLSIEKGTTTS